MRNGGRFGSLEDSVETSERFRLLSTSSAAGSDLSSDACCDARSDSLSGGTTGHAIFSTLISSRTGGSIHSWSLRDRSNEASGLRPELMMGSVRGAALDVELTIVTSRPTLELPLSDLARVPSASMMIKQSEQQRREEWREEWREQC